MDVEGLGDPGQEKNAKAFFDPGKKGRGGLWVILFCGDDPGNSDALGGSAPATGAPPLAMTTYYLQPNSGYRNAPHPPTGDWWRKRGAITAAYFLFFFLPLVSAFLLSA